MEVIFEAVKAHLKRAPSLRGFALVRLSSLTIQASVWPTLYNESFIHKMMDNIEITSDNWLENILKIHKKRSLFNGFSNENISTYLQTSWAYPIIAKPFYDPLSHSIVVPTSVLMTPYFDETLPVYLHYATVGVEIAKEILQSVSRPFEKKLSACVPNAIDDMYPIYTRQR